MAYRNERTADEVVTVERDGPVALVTIRRPERLNALNAAVLGGLREAWEEIRDDEALRAAVLTGAGDRAFCAGADLREMIPQPLPLSDLLNPDRGRRPDDGLDLFKPVVAAVNGHCLGGGMTLLMATDVRVAAPHATFGFPEVTRGIIASCGGTLRAGREVGHARAMELLLTGKRIDAAQAERWGIVNHVVEPDEVLPVALGIAHQIARNAPLAVQATKQLALRSWDLPADAHLRLEETMARLLQESEDLAEGAEAFTQGREPAYRGR